MAVIYRTLGKTDLKVSVIGLGGEHLANMSLEALIIGAQFIMIGCVSSPD